MFPLFYFTKMFLYEILVSHIFGYFPTVCLLKLKEMAKVFFQQIIFAEHLLVDTERLGHPFEAVPKLL